MVIASARWLGLAILGVALSTSYAGAAAVTPVEKVISLMKKLQTDLTAEGKEEAAQYDKYACFCKDEADEKQYNIEKSTKKIEELKAEINQLDAEIAELNKEISDLANDISKLETEIETLTTTREGEHAKYVEEEADMAASIDALKRAIATLEESKDEMDDDAKLNLMQVRGLAKTVMATINSVGATSKHVQAVQSLMQMGQEPAAYEYRSNDIIGTLKGLLNGKFLPMHKELDTAEFKAQAAFGKRTLGLKNEAKFAEKDKAEKEEVVGKKTEEREAAAGDKSQEETDMNADQSFLQELTADCEEKAKLWDQRSKSRAGELTALAEAMDALETGVATTFDANKKLTGFVQAPKKPLLAKNQAAKAPVSFLQLRGAIKREVSKGTQGEQLGALIAAAALRLNSQVLSVAAVKVSSAEDHFVKVRSLIKDLITKLEDQAKEEATQKGFCDTEMAKAVSARDKSQAEVESIAASIEQNEAEKALLTKEIAELSEEIAQEKKALLEASELRAAESKENQETIDTANEGKSAVELAIQVLQEYYSKGASFIEYVPPNSDREGKTLSDKSPEIFDSKYGGNQQASKGIMGLLEVVLSDFDRTITTTKDEESTAATAFDTFKGDAEDTISTKTKSKEGKETRVTTIEDDLIDFENKMKDEKMLLDSALETLSKLQEKCVQGEETYAERVAKRKKEIEALKEALDTLENWQS